MSNKARNKHRSLELADRPGPLKREDVQCPICWSILMEPVRLPCNHNLCLVCFKKHVEETSLQCPCCRMRLSVWSRKAFREKNLIDEKLWTRIQQEFPKLVQTRLLGEDSQDLNAEDLVSVFGAEKPVEKLAPPTSVTSMPIPIIESENSEEQEELMTRKTYPRDGEMNSGQGEIRRELEDIIRRHQEDLEKERLEQEERSANLIRKLEEEQISQVMDDSQRLEEADIALAKKLQTEEKLKLNIFINTKRKLFTEQTSPSSTTSLPKESSHFTPPSGKLSSSLTETPKSRGKRPPLSSLSSRSKKLKKDKSKKLNNSSSQASSGSQSSILSFMTNSQSVSFDAAADPSFMLPSPQSSSEDEHIEKYPRVASKRKSAFSTASTSAFSSTKLVTATSIKSTPINDSAYLSILKPVNCRRVEVVAEEREVSTPDSIDLEVNCHFRPIRSAPKTPPKRLPDGTYEPEPSVIKTTPIKWTSLVADENIKSKEDLDPSEFIDSQKRLDYTDEEYNDEKHVDDGRSCCSSTNSIIVIGVFNKSNTSKDADSATNGNKNENVSPEIPILSPIRAVFARSRNSKTPLLPPNISGDVSSCNKTCHNQKVVKSGTISNVGAFFASPLKNKNLPDFNCTTSPRLIDGEHQEKSNTTTESVVETSPTTSQYSQLSQSSSIEMNFDEINRQSEEFERLRARWLQEEEDRKLARKLQKELNQDKPRENNPYGLRSWLTPKSSVTSSSSSSTVTATTNTRARTTRSSKSETN